MLAMQKCETWKGVERAKAPAEAPVAGLVWLHRLALFTGRV